MLISHSGQAWVCSLLGKNAYQVSPDINVVKSNHQLTFCHEGLMQSYQESLLEDKLTEGGERQAEEALLTSFRKVHQCFLKELAVGCSQRDAEINELSSQHVFSAFMLVYAGLMIVS